ncbi:hypothetical protein BT63DRAFT_424659 [Microthyrium microscopicum]|uniref:Uncharacterized protein n=1 Tax=Microthyrium microscopicum TaxID=703497 RepID=A0A6A6U9S1_9PEZI|nr:hypothetical protein BT63DRAFT_424659 [Microthyrium microscopicum]
MARKIPTSKEWTLRLKNNRRTVLLFADPAQSLSSLKHSLLTALQTSPRAPDAEEEDELPTSVSKIEIGLPVDLFDFKQGFQLIHEDTDYDDEPEETASKSKKGKGRERAAKTSEASLVSLGIKKNYVLAYRFKEEEEDDETMGEDPGWHVEIPVFQDLYGMEVVGDLGANLEYRG